MSLKEIIELWLYRYEATNRLTDQRMIPFEAVDKLLEALSAHGYEIVKK